MKKETRHYLGHYGVHFNVTALTILPADPHLIVDTYDQLPCEMAVAISRPLTREQAELFNTQRDRVTKVIGAIVGAPFTPLAERPEYVLQARPL